MTLVLDWFGGEAYCVSLSRANALLRRRHHAPRETGNKNESRMIRRARLLSSPRCVRT